MNNYDYDYDYNADAVQSDSEKLFNSGILNQTQEITKMAAEMAKDDYQIEEIQRRKDKRKTEMLKKLPSGLNYNLTERINITKANGSTDIISPGFYTIQDNFLINNRSNIPVNLNLVTASNIGSICGALKMVM